MPARRVTLTLNMSEAVTVSGGTPTLTLNDGGTATYISGSGTSALTFSYTVAPGRTPPTWRSRRSTQRATITDGAGNAAKHLRRGDQPGPAPADRHHDADGIVGGDLGHRDHRWHRRPRRRQVSR